MSDFDKINNWHEEAMDLAEMAFFARRENDIYSYWKYINRALNYEKAAARALVNIPQDEDDPTNAIIYQSAIHFALNLDYFSEAKRLANESLDLNAPESFRRELTLLKEQIKSRKDVNRRVTAMIDSLLDNEEETSKNDIVRAIDGAVLAQATYSRQSSELVNNQVNKLALRIGLESKNLVDNPDYQIFESESFDKSWIEEKKEELSWDFWKAYKVLLNKKKYASTTIQKLDSLTNDILSRIGDPNKPGEWDKRGMVVGDVQSGKTGNYIGLINKAADLGFRIVIVLTGLYENLRQQTQARIDEGFTGVVSDLNNMNSQNPIGVGNYRKGKNIAVHPITRAGEGGDLKKSTLPNLPINTNDYYAIVVKKNPSVLRALLIWLHARAKQDGDYRLIKDVPLMVIDDEADYASINVDKDFVSRINSYIRAILALFQQSSFIGYTATPFANVFISDHNSTEDKDIMVDGKQFKLGEILFPKDFIINLPPPSSYIGYSKVFDNSINNESDYLSGELPMTVIVNDYHNDIPPGHRKYSDLPEGLPKSLERAIIAFVLACATRSARGQIGNHNSMLVHVSWYVKWIDRVAVLVNRYLDYLKEGIKLRDSELMIKLESVWRSEFSEKSEKITLNLGYDDPRIIEHDWIEIENNLDSAIRKIEVRAVHGTKKDLEFENNTPLNYSEYPQGLSVIAVGGNKLSRGLTLEGLSISYFLRASRFYDTLLQMGRWFGYRPGYADVCRLFTTGELITWYQHIANSTEELKEQFEVMELSERTPSNFGLKVRSAPGMLNISSAAKIRGATDLTLSYSGELIETYVISKKISSLQNNLNALTNLCDKLGETSGITRQNQPYIWEGVGHSIIDHFISSYDTKQPSMFSNNIRGYIGKQLRHGRLSNWTVVLINNSKADEFYDILIATGAIRIGCTFRKEVERKDPFGDIIIDEENYFIRKSHIISPPHEHLDMPESDPRFKLALRDTINNSKAKNTPTVPAGKFVRKNRGVENALILIYVLDTKGFNGKPGIPAVGYALSLPHIENDDKYPYKVNNQFINELFEIPNDAEEDPESEDE